MAVEARHLNFFPSQIIMNGTGGGMEINNPTTTAANYNITQTDFNLPLSGTTADTLFPFYNSVVVDSVPPMKAESGLTYNPSSSLSRKRHRDPIPITNPIISKDTCNNNNNNNGTGGFTFLGEDISFQIQQQQIEIDRLIAHHTEKVLAGIAERRKRQWRRIAAATEEGMMKRLKAKEEEIEKMGKVNWGLEERVKSLCFENQIWRDLAQTNEATANALRVNLEQVLSKVRDDRLAVADDEASSCGSNDDGVEHNEKRRTLAESEGVEDNSNGNSGGRWCRNCGKEESCVLLLPCRHLCLCRVCGPTVHTCPICKSHKKGTVNVNMS